MKTHRVLLYDDDPLTQQAIRQAYYSQHLDWEMVFATSEDNAWHLIENQSFDALVCDVSGESRNVINLLTTAYNKRPETLRLALINTPSKGIRFELIKYVHQCIAKPIDAIDLISTLKKTLENSSLLENADLIQLVGRIKSLPSLPKLYNEISKEIQSPTASLERIGTLIEKDPAICAKVLQLVNSAFFGVKQNITNPAHALTFLGVETIRDLVLTCEIFSQFNPRIIKRLGLSFLWNHSISVSRYSHTITQSDSFSKSMITHSCTAGLLHDIGKLIFAQNYPTAYQGILYRARSNPFALYQLEINTFGASHAELGAYLLKRWGLPSIVIAAVGYHHFPSKNPTSDFSPTTAVHVADYLDLVRHPYHGCGINELDKRYLEDLDLSDHLPQWEECCSQISNSL